MSPWLRKVWNAITQRFTKVPSTKEELINILRMPSVQTIVSPESLGMIEGVLQVVDMRVEEIMLPRSQMVVVEKSMQFEEVLRTVTESAHSRFPVIGDSRDEIIGILLAKDLLSIQLDPDHFNLRELLRPVVFIPQNKRLGVLLNEFRNQRNHLAIVVDEYGGVLGLITIEDVLEQIVGEIVDEYDIDSDQFIHSHEDKSYTLKARTELELFNEAFSLQFDTNKSDTIGGFVIAAFGRLPRRNECIDIGPLRFTVLHADSRRIHLLKAEYINEMDAPS